MVVEHDRPLSIVIGGRPYIEEQAILGRLGFVTPGWLNGRRAKLKGIPHPWPRLEFGRPAESILA
jgi:hypothetical protein